MKHAISRLLPNSKPNTLGFIRTLLVFSLGLILVGCQLVYRAPMQQGNIITQPSLAQLKLGMTQEQVAYLLGSPILSNALAPERWEYIDYYNPGYKKPIKKRISLLFEQGKLIHIQPLG